VTGTLEEGRLAEALSSLLWNWARPIRTCLLTAPRRAAHEAILITMQLPGATGTATAAR